MRVAIQGCAHGELDAIYAAINRWKNEEDIQVDLLLLCGDVQTMRNRTDLESLACPPKYRRMGDFYDYYVGKKKAPVLTIFIGGNHEASTYLRELYYGGWVAPNIYYLGFAGVILVNGLRIVGLSGIYKSHHYHWGHSERAPFDDSTCRSIYHVRYEDVWKLSWLTPPVDIMLSHDWPQGIEKHGNLDWLLKKKPFFRKEVMEGTLGSPAGRELLFKLYPKKWFSAHLHIKYESSLTHANGKQTEFLALDKCLPGRQYLQLLDLPSVESNTGSIHLQHDPEWMKILVAFHHLFPPDRSRRQYPNISEARKLLEETVLDISNADLEIAQLDNWPNDAAGTQQTDRFCRLLKIKNPNQWDAVDCVSAIPTNPDQIMIDDIDDDDKTNHNTGIVGNPDEITIKDDDEDSDDEAVEAQ